MSNVFLRNREIYMHQFVLPRTYQGEQILHLDGEDFHYLIHVRRMEEGDSFAAISRDGIAYNAKIETIQKEAVAVSLHLKASEEEKTTYKKNYSLLLVQSLPKGKKFETILKQATELGVDEFIPIESENTITRIIGYKDTEKKRNRWEKIIENAVQQSAAEKIPQLQQPVALADIPEVGEKNEIGLFFHEKQLENTSLHGYLSNTYARIIAVIGPEGGFSNTDITILRQKGYRPVTFNGTILRTETAAIAALSCIKTIFEEQNVWRLKP